MTTSDASAAVNVLAVLSVWYSTAGRGRGAYDHRMSQNDKRSRSLGGRRGSAVPSSPAAEAFKRTAPASITGSSEKRGKQTRNPSHQGGRRPAPNVPPLPAPPPPPPKPSEGGGRPR